nr:MAG TPA: hypothetical protein [Caudoviricetes sp.]
MILWKSICPGCRSRPSHGTTMCTMFGHMIGWQNWG